MVSDPELIKEEIADGLASQFKDSVLNRLGVSYLGFRRLLAEEASSLESPFSLEEVKRVVWQCVGSKVPGSDGFNFNFMKKFWLQIL